MKQLISIIVFLAVISGKGFSQGKPYITSGGEMVFSFAVIEDFGRVEGSSLRWSPVFNMQTMINRDISGNMGLFTGIALRNVGYIYENYKLDQADDFAFRKKFRSYNIGVPVGIKLGNLDGMFIYGGYEFEIPVHYKEKTFENNEKIDKITGWFSPRQERLQHGFLVGIQFPYGANLKFKYYLSEFHNRNYVDSDGNRPYYALKSNLFYFSLNFDLFRNFEFNSVDIYRNNNRRNLSM